MLTNKSKLIYKIISTLTIALPLPIFLFLSATIFNVKADYLISNVEIADLSVLNIEDDYFIVSNNNDVIYNGVVMYNVDYDTFVLIVEEDNIIKVGKKFYNLEFDKENNNQLLGLQEINTKKLKQETSTSYKIPIAVFISAFAILIVILVIKGKMQWHKKYPRIAVLTSLLTGTLILYIINFVVGNILNVFLVATITWAIYCLEYMVYSNKLNAKDKAKAESDLLTTLKNALKE